MSQYKELIHEDRSSARSHTYIKRRWWERGGYYMIAMINFTKLIKQERIIGHGTDIVVQGAYTVDWLGRAASDIIE